MKNVISTNSKVNKKYLKKLSKSELIKMLLKLEAKQKKPEIIIADDCKTIPIPTPRTNKPVPTPRTYKPIPKPRKRIPTPQKSAKDMVKEYEENIIIPPPEFRDGYKPTPKPRTVKPSEKPIPKPRTKIKQTKKGFKRLY